MTASALHQNLRPAPAASPPVWWVLLRALLHAALILLFAWVLGWQAAMGRIDPAFAMLWMSPVLLWQVAGLRRARGAVKWACGLLTMALLIAAQAAMVLGLSDESLLHLLRQILVTALWGAAILGLGHYLYSKFGEGRGARWLIYFAANALMIPLAAWLLGLLYTPARAAADAPRAVMLTSLPLRWSGATDLAHILTGSEPDDPILQQLEALGPLQLVDSFTGQVLKKTDVLFLAHPRALSPEQLVAIDAHVRGGGRALILADALSSWPMPHALGDARNPPVTSLLTPLLDHWGVNLRGVAHGESGARWVDDAGQALWLVSAGRFDKFPESCTAREGGYLLHCRIGKGQVMLVGDADYLQAAQWQGQSHLGWQLISSDAIAWTASQLWGGGAGQGFLSPIWLRQPES